MKKLILTSAIAGSGKSTLAKTLELQYEEQGYSVFTIETDMWFVNHGDGTYKFEAEKLGEAHGWTFQEITKALQKDTNIVILANTNLTWKDIRRYCILAISYHYDIEITEPKTSWCNNVNECFKRGTHSVPLDTLEKMEKKRQPIGYLMFKIEKLKREKALFG